MTQRKNYRMIRTPDTDPDGDSGGIARWARDKIHDADLFLDWMICSARFEIDLWLRTTHPVVFVFVACSCGSVAAFFLLLSIALCGAL